MAKLLKSKKDLEFYLEDFMEYCSLKELSRKTINSYESTLMLFFKYLKEEYMVSNLTEVTLEHIDGYLKFTKERGKYSYVSDDKTVGYNHPDSRKDFGKQISDVTINNYIRNMKVFFNYCLEKRYIKKSPMEKVKFVKAKRKMKEDITDLEFKALVKAINVTIFSEYRDYTIIQLIFDTGMRLSETLNLKLEDIDIERRTILIPAEINKGKKDRYVFFSNTMSTVLRKWLQYKDRYCTSDWLFPTKKGTIITASNFERNFRAYKNRAGITKNISPHGLRNNFAKRFLLSGGDIFMLSKILGHSSVTVTEQAYLDVTMTDIRKSYQRYSPLENMR
ncbi:MAG: tyrosine-type recombinase/integrase [Clostridium sp.]|uniref:tyrosine-type recombinase/integrase n=1 Tax=Clostridium TaxID=1485 RepID=UPI0028FF53B1|nr:tyrosine-type recombinase/integrase [Clostridium sp.]MDU1278338.1 tyrosine-type recombinase/integrase [Clostridium sp.]MDU7088057.1 tyrosine-type recombinase/integrase [Clostridium sp.]MDU7948777.1 tyrosine-type recombinase/integrase [Clostridium sp.]